MRIGLIVCVDKEEYVDVEALGSDEKAMAALAMLLNDLPQETDTDSMLGRWAGDRIVFATEGGEPGRFSSLANLNDTAFDTFTDITGEVMGTLEEQSLRGES